MQSSITSQLAQLLRDAIKAVRAGEIARSHTLFGEITERDPQNEAAWLWYANTAENAGDALIGLRAALNINPHNPTALAALPLAVYRAGVAAARANDKRTAAELLAEATSLDSTNAAAWLWRAGVTDDPAKAITFLERVLNYDPTNTQAEAGIAKLRAKLVSARSCPLCEYIPPADDTASNICPECRAVITLSQPEVFDRPVSGINQRRVESAGRRLKSVWATAPTPDTAYALGLAYLNLGFMENGVRAIQTAVQKAGTNSPPVWREAAARFLDSRRTNTSSPGETPPAPSVVGPRVMVVDDSPTVQMLVTTILTRAGYSVLVAADAEEASRLVHDKGPPRLFLLDVNMPGIDGFGLCRFFRASVETAQVPVVFLTGKTGLLNKIHGRWVGAADYLTKPFEPEKLLAAVGRLVPIPKDQTK
jgi:twitching motility two-component system response regulator PilG